MFAVVEIAGKQYKVSPEEKIQVDKLEGEIGAQIVLDKVLLLSEADGSNCQIGQPYVDKKLSAKLVEHTQGDKIIVFKKIAKKRHEKSYGHRQEYSIIEIGSF